MPRPPAASRLASKLAAAKALEAEIKALKTREQATRKLHAEARYRLAGREIVACLETAPDSELGKAVLALLATKLVKPGERRLFPELAHPTPAADTAESPAG